MIDEEHKVDKVTEPKLPQTLTDDLRSLYRRDSSVPDGLDDAVLTAARAHFARRRRRRLVLRLLPIAAAAAAVILLAIPAIQSLRTQARRATPAAYVSRPEDIDRNGRVDILDAFTLARRIDARLPSEPGWDMNNDGRVDATDVDAIAMLAVRIDGG